MPSKQGSRTTNSELRIPWPVTEEGEKETKREDWRDYYDRRYQECCQHAKALEYLLDKYADQKEWLEKHGFDVQQLIQSLRWYPTEELEKLEKAKPSARAAQQEKLRETNTRHYDRMQENLLRLLPLFREVEEEIESVSTRSSTRSSSTLGRTRPPRSANRWSAAKMQSAY